MVENAESLLTEEHLRDGIQIEVAEILVDNRNLRKRVKELLEANNHEVERRRTAEATVRALEAKLKAL